MDGTTPVNTRTKLVSQFNNKNNDIFIFLLTTKVGGLGLNLTAANKIILFDPDWNPSNDIQARERAFRIGQSRDVLIYRFITKFTIEEIILKKQYYKLFLVNKVLNNPDQTHMFHHTQLADLFVSPDDFDKVNKDIDNLINKSNLNKFNKTNSSNNNDDLLMDSILGENISKNIKENRNKINSSMNENNTYENQVYENNAKQLAKESLQKLEDSRNDIMSNVNYNNNIDSRSILQIINQRNQTLTENNRNLLVNNLEDKMTRRLIDYFKNNENKQILTSDIIDNFKDVKRNKDAIMFKKCLDKIAYLKKDTKNKTGIWTLKDQTL